MVRRDRRKRRQPPVKPDEEEDYETVVEYETDSTDSDFEDRCATTRGRCKRWYNCVRDLVCVFVCFYMVAEIHARKNMWIPQADPQSVNKQARPPLPPPAQLF